MPFPKRMVHLDFHTGPDIPDVGRDFNPEQFAQTFYDAHVDSVTVFAMCHHGHLYYDTDHPARHPGLPTDIHLLEAQIDALHSKGIRAPIYISVQCNEYAANQHPDWIALTPELRHVKRGSSAFVPGWQILDMSSPYQDYLADIIDEVLRKFAPVDGLFLDMCWDQPSCSKWAMDGMRKRGLDPREESDRNLYARANAHDYMQRYKDMLDEAQRKCGGEPIGVWFNSRPKTNLDVEKKFLRHIEIEALPTGGWGYAYFPYVSRFVRPLDMPTLSHTGRFFKSWGDTQSLKPDMALKYECCQILSQGMTSGIGDLLHPRGRPRKPVYDLIGRVYSYIESCEPFTQGTKPVAQIAMIVDPALGDNPGPSGLGAVRALQQLRLQFDVVPPNAPLDGYELALVPESTPLTDELQSHLRAYLQNGGSAIFCRPDAVMPEMGVTDHGTSPHKHTFLHALDAVSDGIPDYGHVCYERGARYTPAENAQALVMIAEPYFERDYDHFSGHEYTPEDIVTEYAAAIQCQKVITFALPLTEAYGRHAAPVYRTILGNCVKRLIDPMLSDDGHTGLEATVMRGEGKTIVHYLSFCPERRADGLDIVEDAFPVVNTTVRVKLDAPPTRVYLAPDPEDVPFTHENGYVQATISFLGGHRMLVLEGGES